LNKLPDEFGTLSKLENLAMDSNYNFFSFSATFRTLCSVKTLTASKSGIYAFDSDEFLIHSPLEHLDLSENSLSELPSLQKSKMISTLLRLILFRNSFTVFPQVLLSCTHLQEINLSSNKLKFLPSEIRQLHGIYF
jgi:Leucine-rich repeat (LRR) protein